jgi:hypothetical protein
VSSTSFAMIEHEQGGKKLYIDKENGKNWIENMLPW